jgi:hypothetical protein
VFFDDTEIEVAGHKFEGARINYEGHRALSWQTLWYGPLWVAKTPSVHEAVNFQHLVVELLQLVFRPLTLSNDA